MKEGWLKFSGKIKKYKVSVLIFVVFIVVVGLWFSSWCYLKNTNLCFEHAGQFGDSFGFVNSLFSGLALGGIIISLYLQKDELSLQREELKETRNEFKQQNFENTFFNLLKNQQEISKRIKATFYGLNTPIQIGEREVVGLDFFYYSKRQLNQIYLALERNEYEKYDQEEYQFLLEYESDGSNAVIETNDSKLFLENARKAYAINIYEITLEKHNEYKGMIDPDKMKLVYSYFFKKHQQFIGNYFRHFYHILKFINESELKELKCLDLIKESSEIVEVKHKYSRYSQFLQAQMTTDELMLMFYNSSMYPKALELISKYKVLDNLSVEDLVDKKHNCLLGITLKKRN